MSSVAKTYHSFKLSVTIWRKDGKLLYENTQMLIYALMYFFSYTGFLKLLLNMAMNNLAVFYLIYLEFYVLCSFNIDYVMNESANQLLRTYFNDSKWENCMLLYSVFKIQENLKVPEYLTREIINCGKQLGRLLHSNLKSPI